jgi:hypothetical protein
MAFNRILQREYRRINYVHNFKIFHDRAYLLSINISLVNGILKTSCSGFISGAFLNSTGVLPFISGIGGVV